MLPYLSLSSSRTSPATPDSTAPSGGLSPKARTYLTATAIVFIVLVAALLYGLGTFNAPVSTITSTTTATVSYNLAATSVISSATTYLPPGYLQGSSKPLNANESGLVSGQYALYSNQGGDLVNMTILVFSSPASAARYITSVIANSEDLGGYSDATSTLTSFQHYGVCYGYAESDPEGGEYVANGVCTKGNVYIQVHLASTSSLASAEGDMSAFVGAAYQGLA